MPVGVVLTGGRSTRMGRDKALIEVDGVAMARRVADALIAGGCTSVSCQGGDVDALASLGLDARPDPFDHGGPVPAIAAALRAAAPHDIVVAACDLPDLDAAAVRALVTAGAPGVTLAVAGDTSGLHLAGWWSAGALGAVERLLAEGVTSYRGLVERLPHVVVPVAPASLRNVNRPDDVWRVSSPAMAIAEISVDQLAEHLAAGARLVDVREPAEFDEAHVPGAVLVPLGTVPDQIDAFRGDGPTYVICRSGARSLRACEFVAAQGVEVVNVAGGTMAWLQSGRQYATGAA
jgi:molybdopterin-guanine dinucleotide biosynthesis protein A/rhodanese-related sulfurtransferase